SRRRHTRFSRDWSSDVCSSDLEKQLARNVVPDTLALSDRFAEVGMALQLQLQVALKRLFDVFADQQLAQILQVGQPTEEENALRSEERRVGKECRARWSQVQ